MEARQHERMENVAIEGLTLGVWYVYVDITRDTGKPFYVGKGIKARVNERDRNPMWRNIARKHGWVRTVVMATKDEAFALSEEQRLISELKTNRYADDYVWGANLTAGGEGCSGYKHKEEHIELIRAANKGSNHPQFCVSGRRHPNTGKTRSDEHRLKQRGRKHGEKTRLKLSAASSKNSKITWEVVLEVRRLYAAGGFTQKQLGELFDVQQTTVSNIVNGRTWVEASAKDRGGERNARAKLTWVSVELIRAQHADGRTTASLAVEHGVSEQTIDRIVRMRTWLMR